MIDLTSRSSNPNATRRGLLIDLDMAKDLGKPLEVSKQVGPEITVHTVSTYYILISY